MANQTLNWGKRLKLSLRNKRILVILLVFLFSFLVLYVLSYCFSIDYIDNIHAKLIDPWITIGTFFLAVLIGVQNLMNEWESNLPKKLTVHYMIMDISEKKWKYLLTCEEVSLNSEGDIRAFVQQIGGQMTNNSRLTFDLNFDNEAVREIQDVNGDWVKLYEITFYLTSNPEKYLDNKYKIWWWNPNEKMHQEHIVEGLLEKPIHSSSILKT